MFKVIRRAFQRAASRKFMDENPKWLEARGQQEMSAVLAKHPGWQRVSMELREELVHRIVLADKHFSSFEAAHAFEITMAVTELFDVLHVNILPIDSDRRSVPEKLYLISETFRGLGSRGAREVLDGGNALDPQLAHHTMVNSILCLEAAVIVDHYRLDVFPPMAYCALLHGNKIDKARTLLDEFDVLSSGLLGYAPHAASAFDEANMSMLSDVKVEAARVRTVIAAHEAELRR